METQNNPALAQALKIHHEIQAATSALFGARNSAWYFLHDYVIENGTFGLTSKQLPSLPGDEKDKPILERFFNENPGAWIAFYPGGDRFRVEGYVTRIEKRSEEEVQVVGYAFSRKTPGKAVPFACRIDEVENPEEILSFMVELNG